MVWECGSHSACECGYLKESPFWESIEFHAKSCKLQTQQVFRGVRSKQDVFDTWLKIIQLYSGLLLTEEKDRFAALAGLGQSFQQVLNSQYLAGLWYEDLPRGLLWERGNLFTRSKTPKGGVKIPTWSWASLDVLTDAEARYDRGV